MHRSAPCAIRGQRWATAAAVGAVAAAAVLAGAPTASAADDFLQFSLDGRKYSSSVPAPIFAELPVFFPGSSASATLWVRNASSEPAFLSSAATMVRSDPELDSFMGLRAGSQSSVSARSALVSQGYCTDVGQGWELDAGESIELSFIVDLSVDAPNRTMNRSADVDLLFLLESQAGTAPRPACDAADDGAAGDDAARPDSTPGRSDAAVLPGTRTPPGDGGSEAQGAGTAAATAAGTGSLDAFGARGTGSVPAPGSGSIAAGPLKAEPPLAEPPLAGLAQAGFQSTVEPIIRSLPGTLLIGMSVLFAAVAALRLRRRSA